METFQLAQMLLPLMLDTCTATWPVLRLSCVTCMDHTHTRKLMPKRWSKLRPCLQAGVAALIPSPRRQSYPLFTMESNLSWVTSPKAPLQQCKWRKQWGRGRNHLSIPTQQQRERALSRRWWPAVTTASDSQDSEDDFCSCIPDDDDDA